MVYAPRLGEVGRGEIQAAGVRWSTTSPRLGSRPDLIHGHHHPQTIEALLWFPGVPAVFVSHDASAWNDAAPLFPRIARYVAVDEANRDRLLAEGAPEAASARSSTGSTSSASDPAADPLPEKPRRALVFSNYARETATCRLCARPAAAPGWRWT